MGKRDPAIFIAPGFRFHPTDEELIKFYLKRKLSGKPFPIDAISDADVYKFEPWDLPDKSALRSRDLEWYFFSGLDKKYGHGSKTNRATQRGYWKTTGKDRNIYNNSELVGLKKTLVYHIGRAPKGERTDWVMHEYRLADSELKKADVAQASFVLCRIFQKSGHGPKNGEQHGAPFVEEEWEDDEEVLVTDGLAEDKALISDGAYLETDDLEELINFSVVPEDNPLKMNYYHGGTSNQNVDSAEFSEDGQKPLIGSHESFSDSKLPMPEQQSVNNPFEVGGKLPIRKSFAKAGDEDSGDVNYLLDDPYSDENFGDILKDGLYLETDDLLSSIKADPASSDMFDEYLADFNENDEFLYLPPNNSLVATETHLPLEPHYVQKQASEEHEMVPASKQLAGSRTAFIKHTDRMLESIPAPPAFAAEFPTKEAALRLALATESQNNLNFTASAVLARNTSTASKGLPWSFDKKGKVQLIFSLSVDQGDARLHTAASLDRNRSSMKRTTATFKTWMYLALFWVSLLFVSMKIGSYVYSN